MNNVNAIKERYLKEKKQYRTLFTFFIISICLIALAVETLIFARIIAGEYVNYLYTVIENFNPSDEEIKNIISEITKLPNIISIILLVVSTASTILLSRLSLQKKK